MCGLAHDLSYIFGNINHILSSWQLFYIIVCFMSNRSCQLQFSRFDKKKCFHFCEDKKRDIEYCPIFFHSIFINSFSRKPDSQIRHFFLKGNMTVIFSSDVFWNVFFQNTFMAILNAFRIRLPVQELLTFMAWIDDRSFYIGDLQFPVSLTRGVDFCREDYGIELLWSRWSQNRLQRRVDIILLSLFTARVAAWKSKYNS